VRNFLFKVENCGKLVDAVFFGLLVVVNFDKGDSVFVAVIVDVLELSQDFLALFLVLVVKENCQVGHLGDEHVQHLIVDVLDLIAIQLLFDPLQNFFLLLQISCLFV